MEDIVIKDLKIKQIYREINKTKKWNFILFIQFIFKYVLISIIWIFNSNLNNKKYILIFFLSLIS